MVITEKMNEEALQLVRAARLILASCQADKEALYLHLNEEEQVEWRSCRRDYMMNQRHDILNGISADLMILYGIAGSDAAKCLAYCEDKFIIMRTGYVPREIIDFVKSVKTVFNR